MAGDIDDVVSRLQRWLPTGWFPTESGTRIRGILSGFGSLLASAYDAIAFARLQTRLQTISDGFVDLAAADFFENLPRLAGETDRTYANRIRREVLRKKLTREAIDELLFELTGYHPEITELERGADCFAWRGRYGWRTGHYGSHAWRCAVFIKTTHAGVFGINLGAWRTTRAAWRIPTFAYAEAAMITGTGLTDQQLLDALDRIRAAGVTFWVWIDDFPPTLLADELNNLFVTEDGTFISI